MPKTILAIIFIGASIGLFVMYIQPTYQATQENRDKIASFDEALTKTREIQELKASLLQRRNVFSDANLTRLHKMLPDHVDNVRLVLDLDGIAANYGLRIKNVGIQTAAVGDDSNVVLEGGDLLSKPYQSLTLTFGVEATYEEFMLLLRDLEASLRIVDLTNLTIAPAAAPGTYNFGVAVRTYWLQ